MSRMRPVKANILTLLALMLWIAGARTSALGQDVAFVQLEDPSGISFVYDDARASLSTPADSSGASAFESSSMPNGAAIIAVAPVKPQPKGVDWKGLFAGSATFLTAEHAFRIATEPSTRIGHHQGAFDGYASAVSNLHGWGDGDAFLINYVGHPMQGAVTNFMWVHNDRAFRTVEFGRNRAYWNAKLRGMGFSYVYSTLFEIGPISEASIGHVQSWYPQTGFVDHVVTPTVGMGWAIGEDAIDRMVIQPIERHVANPYIRLFVRGGLNPARSWANVMMWKVPWNRDDRPGVFKSFSERNAAWAAISSVPPTRGPAEVRPGVAPFEFAFLPQYRSYFGNNQGMGPCMGGGGVAAFRLAADWQVVGDVGGCKMLGFKENWSGDSLTYLVGPRWTPQTGKKWVPHLQALIGGMKVTQEYEDPVIKAAVANWPTDNDETRYLKHAAYSKDWDGVGWAVQAGAGVDYKFNRALQIRLANLEYTHAWLNPVNGVNYRNSVQFSGGLVLSMGTW